MNAKILIYGVIFSDVPPKEDLQELQRRISEEPRDAVVLPPTEPGPRKSSRGAQKWYDERLALSRNANGSRAEYACMFVNTPATGSCFFFSISYNPTTAHDDNKAVEIRHQSVDLLMESVEEKARQYCMMIELAADVKPTYGTDEYEVLLSIVDSLSMLLDDTRPLSQAKSSHNLPSSNELGKWIENRKRYLRRRDAWAYTDLMHCTARIIPHNITIIAFPYLWYKAGHEVQGLRDQNSMFYVHDIGRGYDMEQSEGALPPSTIFVQYVGNHYQSMVFLSCSATEDVEEDKEEAVVHAVPTWQRYKWVMRVARYWGVAESGMENIQSWRSMHKCGYHMKDGRSCTRRLGHDETVPHAA